MWFLRVDYFDTRRKSMAPDFGVWVEGMQNSEKGTFLVHESEDIMREIFGNIIKKMPMKLANLSTPEPAHPTPRKKHCVIL